MTEEPTPPPVVETPQDGVEPPPRLNLGIRNPVGWIVTILLLVANIGLAVYGYVDQGDEPVSQASLQQTLRYHLSIEDSKLFGTNVTLGDQTADALVEVLDEATEESRSSEEAARIAAVTAKELDRSVPRGVIRALRSGNDDTSRAMYAVLSHDPPLPEHIEALEALGSQEFAVQLAIVQAKESREEPAGRDEILDSNLVVKLGIAAMIGLLGLVAGAFCLIGFLFARSGGKLEPVGLGLVTKSFGDRMAARFALYMSIFLVVSLIIGVAAQVLGNELPIQEIWLQVIGLAIAFAILVATLQLPIMGKQDPYRVIIGETKPFFKLVGIGIYGYLCTLPILAAALALIAILSKIFPAPNHPISEDMASANGVGWLGIFVLAAILAPLIEELAFRGLLFPALASQFKKPWVAMVMCGLVFAAIHPQGPLAWPALATTGAAAAALRYYSGSLVPSIVLHMVHNSVIVVIGLLIG